MKYAYLYIPGIMILLLPILKGVADARKEKAAKKRMIAEKERREAARREALRKANEERKAKKAAEEAAKAAMPKRKPGRPRKNPLPEQRPETISPTTPSAAAPAAAPAAPFAPAAPVEIKRPVTYIGNNQFAGETVAFTGTLPGMTRREAIDAVKKNGGRAFENMPAGTTILVVGDRPGKRKLDNADKWIGSCRKITAMEFSIMLQTPLTLTPEQFEDYVRTVYAAA